MSNRIKKTIRGFRDAIPSGYLLGRTDQGTGPAHLVKLTDFNAQIVYKVTQSGSLLPSALASGDIFVGNASGVASPVAMSGDGTITNAGILTVTKSGGVAFGSAAFTASSAYDAAGAAATAQTNAEAYADTGDALRVLKAGDTMGGALGFPNGSAASPSAFWNTNYGLFYDATHGALGISAGGVQFGYIGAANATTVPAVRFSMAGSSGIAFNMQSEAISNNQVETYSATSVNSGRYTLRRGRGTIASPAVPITNDILGRISIQPWTGVAGSGFTESAAIIPTLIETSAVDSTHVGTRIGISAAAIGSATLTEILRTQVAYSALLGPVTIGAIAAPTASATLDLSSTTGALLIPRMTTTQKNALTASNGMVDYDSTLNKFQFYENGAWTGLGSGSGTVTTTGSPASGNLTKFSGTTSITNGDLSGDVTTAGALVTTIKTDVGLAGNPTTTTQATTDNSTRMATTAYVTTAIANAVAAVNPAVAVNIATTAASDTSGLTYANGVSGVGATFTGTANTALTIDGHTFTALGERLLVKNDTQSPSGAFNGVYSVTQIQTALLPPILTRALDYDMPSDMNNTGAIPVISGTVNALTSWLLTSNVVTVGTSPLTYVQFSFAPTSAANPTATASDTAVNGSATTFMRSDAAPAIQKASSSAFGLAKVDNVSITAAGGIISAVAGGGTTGSFHPGYATGRYYQSPYYTANSFSLATGTLWFTPFYVPQTTTFTKISIRSSTVAVGTPHAALGIYSNSNGQPSALVQDCGRVALVASSINELTGLTITLAAGWYWLAVSVDTTNTLFGCTSSSGFAFLQGSATGSSTPSGYSQAWVYNSGANTLPAVGSLSETTGTIPSPFLRL